MTVSTLPIHEIIQQLIQAEVALNYDRDFVYSEIALSTLKSYASAEILADCSEADLQSRALIQIITEQPLDKDVIQLLEQGCLDRSDETICLYRIAKLCKSTNALNCFYQIADASSIPPSDYCINLMWINQFKLKEDAPFLIDTAEKTQRLAAAALKWADKNPQTPIYIWYDQTLVSKAAIENASALFKDHPTIQFCDIRMLPLVKLNPNAFDELVPIYTRVDLLKAVISEFSARLGATMDGHAPKPIFSVTADLDVPPISGAQLFDQPTLMGLEKIGLVMAWSKDGDFENSFFILNGHHTRMLEKHRYCVICPGIAMAQVLRNDLAASVNSGLDGWTTTHADLMQHVFQSYKHCLANVNEECWRSLGTKVVSMPRSQFYENKELAPQLITQLLHYIKHDPDGQRIVRLWNPSVTPHINKQRATRDGIYSVWRDPDMMQALILLPDTEPQTLEKLIKLM